MGNCGVWEIADLDIGKYHGCGITIEGSRVVGRVTDMLVAMML